MPRIEQLPLIRDYTVVQGSTWKRRFVWKPGGIPILFGSDWSALLQVRAARSGLLLAQIDSYDLGGIVLGDLDGSIYLEMGEASTRAITGSAIYALELLGPDGTTPFLRGRMRPMSEVSV